MSKMMKYFETWEKHIREQLSLPPSKKPPISKEEWDKMSPKEKIKFIRDWKEKK